jgi:hypothetical protein
MRIQTGALWDEFKAADLFLICSHSTVIAKKLSLQGDVGEKAVDMWPGIDTALATKVKTNFGLLVTDKWGTNAGTWTKFGLFQTRYKPNEKLNINVVQNATEQLTEWATGKPDHKIILECPVTKYSTKREWNDTLNVLSALPHNVIIVTPLPWYSRPHWILDKNDEKWMTADGITEATWRIVTEKHFGGDPDNFFFGNARRLMPGSPLFLMWPLGFVERMNTVQRAVRT